MTLIWLFANHSWYNSWSFSLQNIITCLHLYMMEDCWMVAVHVRPTYHDLLRHTSKKVNLFDELEGWKPPSTICPQCWVQIFWTKLAGKRPVWPVLSRRPLHHPSSLLRSSTWGRFHISITLERFLSPVVCLVLLGGIHLLRSQNFHDFGPLPPLFAVSRNLSVLSFAKLATSFTPLPPLGANVINGSPLTPEG